VTPGRRGAAITLVVLMAALVVALGARAEREAAPVGREAAPGPVVRDMAGREVAVATPVRRIISLVPSFTEIVYAIGGQDSLVGVTDFCDYPAAAREKKSVGGMVAPSLEAIVALKPDLVVATSAGNSDETFTQLKRLGVPTYVVDVNHFVEMMDLIRRAGALTGRRAEAAPLIAALEGRITAVRRAVASLPVPHVLYVIWPEPLIVPGRDVLITEIIQAAGGRSVTADEASSYPRFSLEAAVARGPDVIVLARHGSTNKPLALGPWERLSSLPAIKTRRIHAVDGAMLHRYGPRVIDGLEQLARLLHPEAFR
jgi:iron complex transport system substrate-binding protein